MWSRLGDVRNYVEPFFGSGAVLLARPAFTGTETVNDLDGMIANFWRALQSDPDGVADYADWPVSELDLHARHSWLIDKGLPIVERLREDPKFYDVKIAGWWCWGICAWIGGGWCEKTTQQRPHLGDAGSGVHAAGRGDLHEYLASLSARLRRVRVCCGDWSRVCGPTPTIHNGLTGVFLDPPYVQEGRSNVYAEESDCAHAVMEWSIANGDNPLMRIAYCGYESPGFDFPGWDCVEWKAGGGYGNQAACDSRGKDNCRRERIWFSPHCLPAVRLQERMEFDDN